METTEVIAKQKLQTNLNTLIENTLEEKKDLDFFFSNNASQPKSKTKYETTKIRIESRIKSCNFLTNISYRGMKEEDLFDRSFVFDVYTMTTKNINPFSLERKIFDVKDCKMIIYFGSSPTNLAFTNSFASPQIFCT